MPDPIPPNFHVRDVYIKSEGFGQVATWWDMFHKGFNYPLYCIILADTSDSEAALVTENYRREIDEISGADCCFIYFRDLVKAKNLIPFEYQEHTRHVYRIAEFIGIDLSRLPCLLFFEQLVSGKYISISLANRSQEEIIMLIREVFSHIRRRKMSSRLARLKKFKHSLVLKVARQELIQNTTEIVTRTLTELLHGFLESLFRGHP